MIRVFYKAMQCGGIKIAFILVLVLFFLFSAWLFPSGAFAAEHPTLKGRVFSVDNQPVEGSEIFVYNSSDIKKPADFISPKTDRDGRFHMVLPAGKYWVVARVRKGEKYGPLMIGDKHSGEPVEIELVQGKELYVDFMVADIREIARLNKKRNSGYLRVKGRIIYENNVPVKGAYALADRDDAMKEIPDFLSSWTDGGGEYVLYLPKGRYFIGAAMEFPPEKGIVYKEVVIEKDTDFDIVLTKGLKNK